MSTTPLELPIARTTSGRHSSAWIPASATG